MPPAFCALVDAILYCHTDLCDRMRSAARSLGRSRGGGERKDRADNGTLDCCEYDTYN